MIESPGLQNCTLVSVIIPSRNRREDLRRCLRSIERQSLWPQRVQAIVVDDCSSDGSEAMVREEFRWAQMIVNKTRQGPSLARNQAIVRSLGEYLLFLDSDSELPADDTLTDLVAAMNLQPDIGCLGGEIRVYEGERDRAVGRSLSFRGTTRLVSAMRGVGLAAKDLVPCDYSPTCACVVRRELALRCGGFDPHFDFGGEDVDFELRVMKQGYQNYVLFAAGVKHHKSPSGRLQDETYCYQRGRIRTIWKNSTPGRIAGVLLIDFVDALLFYPLLPFKLLAKLALGRPIGRESFTGGLILLQAYRWNLRRLTELRRSIGMDFLAPMAALSAEGRRADIPLSTTTAQLES